MTLKEYQWQLWDWFEVLEKYFIEEYGMKYNTGDKLQSIISESVWEIRILFWYQETIK